MTGWIDSARCVSMIQLVRRCCRERLAEPIEVSAARHVLILRSNSSAS